MIKELKQEEFAAPIIRDLGMMKPSETAKRTMRFVELECSTCKSGFVLSVDNAKRRQEHTCPECKTAFDPMRLTLPLVKMLPSEKTDVYPAGIRFGLFECVSCHSHIKLHRTAAYSIKDGKCSNCSPTKIQVIINGEIHLGNLLKVYSYCNGVITNNRTNERIGPSIDGRSNLGGVKVLFGSLAYMLAYEQLIPKGYSVEFKDPSLMSYKKDNLQLVCEKPRSDNDVFYIWKVIGLIDVYKIGVTSFRLGEARINSVAKSAKVEYTIILMANVFGKATTIETEVLNNTKPYIFKDKFDGHTEFRVLNPLELEGVKSLAFKYTTGEMNGI